jgi:hypothetical protein
MGRHGVLEERASLGYRLFFPVPGIYFLIGTVVYFDGGSDLPFTAGIFALGLALTGGPFRPLVRKEGDSLLLRGFVLQRKVPLASITGVQSTYGGLEVAYSDDKHFRVPLIGETMNLTRWRGRTSHGDALASRIMALRRDD